MATPFASDGKLGVNSTGKYGVAQEFHVGTPFVDNQGRRWTYVLAPGAIAAGADVAIATPAYTITVVTGGPYRADSAFAAGEFGWVRQTASP